MNLGTAASHGGFLVGLIPVAAVHGEVVDLDHLDRNGLEAGIALGQPLAGVD